AQQRELFAGRFCRHFGAYKVVTPTKNALLTPAGLECVCADAHGHASRTALTGRAIGDGLAAAETGMGEGFRQRLGQVATQPRKYLAFRPARQVRARPAWGQEKLRYACTALVRHCEYLPAPDSIMTSTGLEVQFFIRHGLTFFCLQLLPICPQAVTT